MSRDKDDEKLMKPLFPRVHVRDTDKGWPRAPPRNKMALYERFTVSSHKSIRGNLHSGYESAANLNFSVQETPPAIPVRVSREHNVQSSDVTSVVSREPKALVDDYTVSGLENGNAGFDHCESDAENGFTCGDGETGNVAEISSCLDDGIVPAKRSRGLIVLDNNEDDSNAGVSDISMEDSASGREISLDSVVDAIGHNRFWRAKHAISKQQRVFAKQVFQLHRLVKVQRLIAESPHLVFDVGAIEVKSPSKEELLEPDSVAKPRPRYDGFKDDVQKADHDHGTEVSAENTPQRLPPPSQGRNCYLPPNLLHPQGVPSTTDLGRSLQQPSGHHWLIPVMSPSEGLVYKPYPAPPRFTPCYGGCGHFCNFNSQPPQQQGPPFSLPVAHPMLSYFPPYGMPVIHPTTFPGMHMDERMASDRTSSVVQDQSSCNMPGRANVTAPPQVTTRESVRLEPRRHCEDAFRRPSSLRDSDGTTVARPGRVIRAVPCNPRLASESAARIFRSIQEERTQV